MEILVIDFVKDFLYIEVMFIRRFSIFGCYYDIYLVSLLDLIYKLIRVFNFFYFLYDIENIYILNIYK